MSKTLNRKLNDLDRKRKKYGYFGYFRLAEIYPFLEWMQKVKGFKLDITRENELAVLRKDGRELRIWYDPKIKECCTSRYGMVMWYDYHIFEVDDM